jgi:hypothetical protein
VGAVLIGAAGFGLSRFARRLTQAPLVRGGEAVVIAFLSALLFAGSVRAGWLVPLAPLVAGGLAASVQGRATTAWPIAVVSTVLFGVAFAAVDPLALIPRLAALGLGILGVAYAIGRWTDLHAEAADAPPNLLTYGSLAVGFVLVYWRPTF